MERLPHPRAAELLALVLDRLEAAAGESAPGVSWFTSPNWLTPGARQKKPEGCYDLGVAHGVPGVLGFLAAAQRAGARDPRIRRLAEGAVPWLQAQKLAPNDVSVFPGFLIPGQEPEPTRTAWCYGDLGIACVLLSAARSFGNLDWEREAIDLARGALDRPAEVTQTTDPGLCHGWAGHAHLYNRLFQATGDPDFKEAALLGYQRAAEGCFPAADPESLSLWLSGEPGLERWQSEYGFLSGAAGVGLALLGANTEIEPVWDRVLLVSIPTAGPLPRQVSSAKAPFTPYST